MAYNIPDVDNGRFSLNAGESLLQHHDNVQLGLSGDNLPQFLKESKKGKIHLTTQRVIFVVTKSTGGMKSFSMPFYYMKEVEVKQPIFGANALTGDIKAQPNGGWEGKAKFRFDFNSGGAVEFSTTLLRVATKAPKGPPPAPGQAPPAPKNYQTGFYPAPMPNGGAPYGYPTAPPAGGYPPAPPAGGYPPAPGGYPPAPGGYPPQPAMAPPAGYGAPDPAYPPPAYSEAVAGAGVAPSAPPTSVYTKLTTTKLGFEPSQQAHPVNSPPCICNTYFGNPYYKPCNHIKSFPPTYGNPYRKGVYTNTFKTVFGNPYTPTDPRYIQPGGNAYYDPNIPQQAYIPQAPPQTQPPAYSEKPKME